MRALAVLLLVACNGGDGSDTGSEDTGSTDFDPYEGLAGDPECEDFEGTPYNGATGFFVGEFAIDGDILTGVEDWVLFANAEWQTNGGSDCTMRWDAFGTVSEPTGCTGCSHEIALDLTFDGDASDCVQGLEDIEGQDGNVTYYVFAQPDGTARFEFTDGDLLGNGVLTETRAAYVSEAQCNVF